jgi:3-oxoacyl-[acyl-carrier-protein] synthase II
MKRRVVVTGLGIITSLSCQLDDLWRRLLAGESGIHALKIFDTERFKVRFGGDVYDWNPEQWPEAFTDRKEIKRVDRSASSPWPPATTRSSSRASIFRRKIPSAAA